MMRRETSRVSFLMCPTPAARVRLARTGNEGPQSFVSQFALFDASRLGLDRSTGAQFLLEDIAPFVGASFLSLGTPINQGNIGMRATGPLP